MVFSNRDMLSNDFNFVGRWVARTAMLGDDEAMKLCALTGYHSYQAEPVEIFELFWWVKRAADLGDVQAQGVLGGFSRGGLIITNDKVVCIDATDYGYDKHDNPNGFVQRGRVYCVAGWSERGGLVLVGLPCLWKHDGSEVGFNPKRFKLLKSFRAQLSAGNNLSL